MYGNSVDRTPLGPCKSTAQQTLVMVGISNRWFTDAVNLQDFRLNNNCNPLSAPSSHWQKQNSLVTYLIVLVSLKTSFQYPRKT